MIPRWDDLPRGLAAAIVLREQQLKQILDAIRKERAGTAPSAPAVPHGAAPPASAPPATPNTETAKDRRARERKERKHGSASASARYDGDRWCMDPIEGPLVYLQADARKVLCPAYGMQARLQLFTVPNP